ncbi:MAG: hypothetical protein WBJ62_05530 [Coriobacteriia bacterium]
MGTALDHAGIRILIDRIRALPLADAVRLKLMRWVEITIVDLE